MNYINRRTIRIIGNLIMLWAGAIAQHAAAEIQGTHQQVTFLGKMTTQELMTPSAVLSAGALAKEEALTRAPQTLGLDFAANKANIDGTAEVPPDAMGDVGPTQYILNTNGLIRTFDKATGLFDNVLNLTIYQFYASVQPQFSGDVRIRYDHMSDRWFLAFEDINSVPNRVILAMSDSGIITKCTTWCFFEFPLDYLLDFITLGVDKDAVYLAVNGRSSEFYVSPILLVVNKALLIGAGAQTCVTAPLVTTFVLSDTSAYGPVVGGSLFCAQPATNFDTTTTVGVVIVGQFPATSYEQVLVSLFAFYINDPSSATPTLSPLFNVAPDSYIAQPIPTGLQVLGSSLPVQTLDSPFISTGPVISNGNLFISQGLGMDAAGTSTNITTIDRVGVRWYEMTNLVSTVTPTIIQTGTLVYSGMDLNNYFEPSVMVSGQGHMALGCSFAGTTTYLNAVTCGRLFTDPAGTLQLPPVVYPRYSTSTYNLGFELGFGYRWGEYTSVGLDPSDNMTMWCNQVWCNTDDSWACQVVKLLAPPPATPSGVLPSPFVPAGQPSVTVTITGNSVDGSGFYNFCPHHHKPCTAAPGQPTLNYKDPHAFWIKQMTATVTGGVTLNGAPVFNSPTSVTLDLNTTGVVTIVPLALDVTITNPDGQSATGNGILIITP